MRKVGKAAPFINLQSPILNPPAPLPPLPDTRCRPRELTCRAMDPRKPSAVRLRPRTRPSAAHRVAVFTSVDGTLLDARTFEPGASRAAIRRLGAAGVPVIPVSVMTFAELAPIADELGLRQAMIVEAGGAIARWTGAGWDIEACGPPAEALLDVVLEIEKRTGAYLLVPSAQREFSEAFSLESGNLTKVKRAAAAMGFSVRRGRRFFHLCRSCDQGEAFTRLRAELRCETAIALGGAAVDTEFLSRADIPIIVPGPDGTPDPELLASVPHARIAPRPGPAGWAAAIDEVWQGLATAKRRASN